MFATVATTATVNGPEPQRRGRAMSLLLMSETLGLLLGSAAGGWLYRRNWSCQPLSLRGRVHGRGGGHSLALGITRRRHTVPATIAGPTRFEHSAPDTGRDSYGCDDRAVDGHSDRYPRLPVPSLPAHARGCWSEGRRHCRQSERARSTHGVMAGRHPLRSVGSDARADSRPARLCRYCWGARHGSRSRSSSASAASPSGQPQASSLPFQRR